MKIKYIFVIATMIIIPITILSGCYQIVKGEIHGTIGKITLKDIDTFSSTEKNNVIEVTFVNNSYCILDAKRYNTDDGTDWYDVLEPHIGENVTITWAQSTGSSIANILYVNFD